MKILLLGIGNILFADEGIGVHFVNYLDAKYDFNGDAQITLMDGGTLAQRLIPIMVEYDQVIIVDTVNAVDVSAGEVYFFDFEQVPDAVDWQGSAHEVEMLQTLTMMELAGDRPVTKILGIVPTVIDTTTFELSERVIGAVPLMERTLLAYLEKVGVHTHKRSDVTFEEVIPQSYRLAAL